MAALFFALFVVFGVTACCLCLDEGVLAVAVAAAVASARFCSSLEEGALLRLPDREPVAAEEGAELLLTPGATGAARPAALAGMEGGGRLARRPPPPIPRGTREPPPPPAAEEEPGRRREAKLASGALEAPLEAPAEGETAAATAAAFAAAAFAAAAAAASAAALFCSASALALASRTMAVNATECWNCSGSER